MRLQLFKPTARVPVGAKPGVATRPSFGAAGRIFALATLLWVSGCATSPAQKEQTKTDFQVSASAQVNPDDKGRPSPIRFRVYELKSAAAFEAADYFSIANNDKAVLGGDLLSKEEFILRPGETRIIKSKTNPETTALGFIAGYRDLANSTWRVVKKLPPAPEAAWYRAVIPANKTKLMVQLQDRDIELTELE